MPVTVAFMVEGIKKLRALNIKPEPPSVISEDTGTAEHEISEVASNRRSGHTSAKCLDLWRGLKNTSIHEQDAIVTDGVTELAPLSTTTSLEVALAYSESAAPVLIRLHTENFLQQGVDISFLSAFPAEEERLYPPLTYLQPYKPESGQALQRIKVPDAGSSDDSTTTYTVITVVPTLA
jgi:hypothetical protein